MKTALDDRELDQEPAEETDEDEQTRRLLRIVVIVLGLAVLGLLLLLLWLFGPLKDSDVEGSSKGYPIDVVRALTGPERDPIRTPLGVGFAGDGNVWLADTGNSRAVVMTTGGDVVRLVGDREGRGRLTTPYGIAPDARRERVWVADWSAGSLVAYSEAGRYIERFPASDQDLAIFGEDGFTPYDVRVFGSRVIASSNDGLYVFDRTGHVTARWGGTGRGLAVGQFNFPDAFDIDAERGRIYVADSLNRRVVALDLDGNILWISGVPDQTGKIMGFWQLPRGIAVQPDGNVLVVDTFRAHQVGVGTGYFVLLSPKGELVSEFGRSGDQEDSFSFPDHMVLGPDGLYAVADREHHRILLFRIKGQPEPDALELDVYERSFSKPDGVNMLTRIPKTESDASQDAEEAA